LLKYLEFKNNFKLALVKKISRIKVHNTLAFPILFHGREIWTLRKKDKK
jgi:NADPH-dependent 7-cyano-7-deazaguanine reductase QueF-like protein